MAGTVLGAQHTKKTLLKKFGSKEKLSEYYRNIGKKGGQACVSTKGFGCLVTDEHGLTGPERARICGIKGGKLGKRGPAKKKVED